MIDDTLYLSPSSINDFFACPARFQFRRMMYRDGLVLKKVDKSLRDGTNAHAMMEGRDVPRMSKDALEYFTMLKRLETIEGYEVHERERRESFVLLPGIILTRVIDGVATLDGEPVLIDYKTARYPWRTIGDSQIKAKGMGFQATAYLIAHEPNWPERIDFLVAPLEYGDPGVYTYNYSKEDEENFYRAVNYVSENRDCNIKVRGLGCDYCPFASACYQIDGWENDYERKEN